MRLFVAIRPSEIKLRLSSMPDEPVTARFSLKVWIMACCLVVAICATYSNSLSVPFFFDDQGAVENNATIRDLFSWSVFSPPADGSTTTGRPLVNLSLAFNYAFSGENVFGYHLTNLLLHAVSSCLLLGILRRTLVFARFPGMSESRVLWYSAGLAALWALHPLQTESVTCIAQRTELLCSLFYLATLYCFIRSVSPEAKASCWQMGIVACCALGMASKEVMVTAPVLVLLYDRTFIAGGFLSALRARRGLYLALACTWGLLAIILLCSGGSRGVSAGFGIGVTPWTYLLTQCEALMRYLGLSIWPSPLVVDYGTGVVESLSAVWWQGLLILSALGLSVWALVRHPRAGFLCAGFFLILAPSSSVVPLVSQTMAEHRMYLPLAFVLCGAIVAIWRFYSIRATAVLLAVLIPVCALMTWNRNENYQDEITLWTYNIRDYPKGARAYNNLGLALQNQGRLREAAQRYAEATTRDPGYASAFYNWGVLMFGAGKLDEAERLFSKAVTLAPLHPDAQLNLGNVLVRQGRAAEAIPHYQESIRLKPAADAHFDLGIALAQMGRNSEAWDHFAAALQITPELSEAHFQLGRLAEQLHPEKEEAEYKACLGLNPRHIEAHRALAMFYVRTEHIPLAAEQLGEVIALNPSDADAHANLGNVYLVQGDAKAAIREYETALRLRPSDSLILENLRMARESLK
jgi:tetratricopeptide (TPR) repeat protein